MKVKVISEFSTARGLIKAGQIIDITPTLLDKLKGKVEPIIDVYCPPADCWCSERHPARNYPAGCIQFNCKHHQGAEI
jgi:hypothetical protein